MSTNYILGQNVSIYKTNPTEIRIRKGIWNYEEAVLDMSMLSKELQDVMAEVLDKLDKGESIQPDVYIKERISEPESQTLFSDAINSLKAQKYLVSTDESKTAALMTELLGGVFANRFGYVPENLQPVLYITDLDSTAKYVKFLSEDIGLPATVVSVKELHQFAESDLTTRYEGLSTTSQYNELSKILSPYKCVAMALSNPGMTFLRNLNRVAVADSVMLSMALIDGPFLTAMTFKPTETGCFECFENRVMARLQEISAYREFSKKFTIKDSAGKSLSHISPLLNTFASIPMFEAFMYSCIGKTTLAGRILNVYLPALEIQVQDLLRISSCPACGFISLAKMEEMYTSTTKIVENLASKILITE